jgi:hypothetical protein
MRLIRMIRPLKQKLKLRPVRIESNRPALPAGPRVAHKWTSYFSRKWALKATRRPTYTLNAA